MLLDITDSVTYLSKLVYVDDKPVLLVCDELYRIVHEEDDGIEWD
jgi:hypothetical protein